MQIDTQFSVFLVNQPGVLAKISRALSKAKVNIQAMTLVDSSEHGVLRFVCDDADTARDVLKKLHDHWAETEVLNLTLRNEPGALADVAETLADAHINISYAYSTSGAPGGRTTCVFKVADLNGAMKIVQKKGLAPARSARPTRNVRPTPR